MSVLLMKLLAVLAMCLDHIGIVFGIGGWNFINNDTYRLLRGIGRISFPVYAFLLVNGWQKTKNLSKYISRLLIFACISQIPFNLAFYAVNLMPVTFGEIVNKASYNGCLGIEIFLVLIYYFFQCKNHFDISIILLAFALFASGFSLKVNGVWILSSGNLNIFYTLFIGLLMVIYLNKVIDGVKEKWYKNIILLIAILLGNFYIAIRSDYGFAGIVLICGLYLFRKRKYLQVSLICLWGIMFYGILHGNIYNAIFTCISAVIVLLYNGKKGISVKYFFYVFYPLHLFILGLFNVAYKFIISNFPHEK